MDPNADEDVLKKLGDAKEESGGNNDQQQQMFVNTNNSTCGYDFVGYAQKCF